MNQRRTVIEQYINLPSSQKNGGDPNESTTVLFVLPIQPSMTKIPNGPWYIGNPPTPLHRCLLGYKTLKYSFFLVGENVLFAKHIKSMCPTTDSCSMVSGGSQAIDACSV